MSLLDDPLKLQQIKRETLRLMADAAEVGKVYRRAFSDDAMLRWRMKEAVAEACGARRADELFPPSTDTLKIRLPKR